MHKLATASGLCLGALVYYMLHRRDVKHPDVTRWNTYKGETCSLACLSGVPASLQPASLPSV